MLSFESEKIKTLVWIIAGAIIVSLGIWAGYRFFGGKSLEVVSPNAKEKLVAGKTYQITWKAKNIGNIGITLIKGGNNKEAKWLAKDIPAGKKKYDWEIFAWETPGQDYKIAIFEYPWKDGSIIDYSDDNFAIVGPKFASCDQLSITEEWPYVPSDFPDLKKVFITKNSWQGNLEGLDGADQKCQSEAKAKDFEGNWKAFLGDDENLAIDRLNLDGIFVEAEVGADVPEGKTCHRLLGRNFDEFFKKLSDTETLNKTRFSKEFFAGITNAWLGRANKESKKNCALISSQNLIVAQGNYSFTATCQNWTTSNDMIAGYPPKPEEKKEFPQCYTVQGTKTDAVSLAGLASSIITKKEGNFFSLSDAQPCSSYRQLICIQQPEKK